MSLLEAGTAKVYNLGGEDGDVFGLSAAIVAIIYRQPARSYQA